MPSRNSFQNILTAFASFFVMAGFLTQLGVISGPMSHWFDITITAAASQFSFLTGGVLVGTFVSMAIFDYLPIRRIYHVFYLLITASVLSLLVIKDVSLLSVPFAIIGMSCGVGLSAACIIISQVVQSKYRASAFVATDVFFSLAGAIIPASAASFIADGSSWYSGYMLMLIPVVVVVALTLLTRYPETVKSKAEHNTGTNEQYSRWNQRVFMMGGALCLYLVGQNSFLAWAPTYLQNEFQLTALEAGAVVGNYWGPSALGLVISAVILSRVPSRLFLLIVVALAVSVTTAFTQIRDAGLFMLAASAFGFLTSSMYKVLFSTATEQVGNPAPRMVTFLLCCGTVGSAVAPVFSSFIVNIGGAYAAIVVAAMAYAGCAALIISTLFIEKVSKRNPVVGAVDIA